MSVSLREALLDVFGNPTTLMMVALAAATVHFSALRTASLVKRPSPSSSGAGTHAASSSPSELSALGDRLALAIPFVAAIMLLAMFFLKEWLGPLLVLAAAGVAFVAIPFALHPVASHVMARCRSSLAPSLLSGALTAVVVLMWLVSGHWILNNIIAASLCILMVSLVRVPSFRVITVLFCGLLVYDVLMVFVSPYILSKNVMVEVATQEPQNPASVVSEALHLPFGAVKKLSFPGKLIVPSFAANASHDAYSLLGLGDCMIPGLLLAYMRSFEIVASDSQRKRAMPYYSSALATYIASLFVTFLISLVSGAAQPALLYIVPLTLGVTFACARRNGEWSLLWSGPPDLIAGSFLDFSDREERVPLAESLP